MSPTSKDYSHLPPVQVIKQTLPAVVQIIALKKGYGRSMSAAWTGSGTIVDGRGVILTNCHVANPQAMGMPSPAIDALGIAITARSDEPPALTYLAEIVVQSPELDLAVLRITEEVNGRSVRGLRLPFVPIGDSDVLDLGDTMAIFGYPGIGGETVTFTSGSVAGFSKEPSVKAARGWIKTDATIAGGNSGGTAIDFYGNLVGIPTQASAGTGISPVDARPVIDTNRDGRIDQKDSPIAIGGFINGLRPINLAKPLLQKAGVSTSGAGSRSKVPMVLPKKAPSSARPAGSGSRPASSSRKPAPSGYSAPAQVESNPSGPQFTNLSFSSRVTRDGRPINPTTVLSSGLRQIHFSFDFDNMRTGRTWKEAWYVNGQVVVEKDDKWKNGPRGRKVLSLANEAGLPEGRYQVQISVSGDLVAQADVTVGQAMDDQDTQIIGQIVDSRTSRGISGALVIVLKPDVRVMDFVRYQNQNMAFTSTKTDRSGAFRFAKQLPKGNAYSLVVVARGYQDLVVESALRISPNAPEEATINPIPMERE